MVGFLLSLLSSIGLTQVCPGSDEVPAVLSVPIKNDRRLFVCGFEDQSQKLKKGKKQLSDFSVYYETPTQQVQKVFSVGAEEFFWVSLDKKRGLLFEEVVWVVDRYVPLFRSYVSCKENTCWRTESECMVPQGRPKYPDIVRQIDKKLRGKFSKIQEPVGVMIQMALSNWLAGDKSVAPFFESVSLMDKMEISAGQQFLVSKKIYDRVKGFGCYKLPPITKMSSRNKNHERLKK